MRLAIIAIAPAPYHERLFERLAVAPGIDFKVFYLHSKDSLRGWTAGSSYSAEFAPCWTPERFYPLPLLGAVNPGLVRRLRRFAPDCLLIHGHSFLAQLWAMNWAKRRGVPYLLRCDSNLNNVASTRQGSPARWTRIKEKIIRGATKRAAGVISIGEANDRYWAYFGVPEAKRFLAPFAVDNEFFTAQAERFRPSRGEIRENLGIQTAGLITYVGRFVPPKNLLTLLRGWKLFGHAEQSLLLVGSGPLEAELKSLVRREQIQNVVFAPFVENREVARYYAASDAVILPSLFEPWGLVVNEAMASGLPVLVSERCGCAPDLVEQGVNGFRFDARTPESIAAILERYARLGPTELASFGAASRRIIAGINYDEAVDGILRAVYSAARA